MTIIARKDGEKFETIKKTNFELEDKLQKLIVDDQIMKKIKLGMDEDTTLVTLSREFESGRDQWSQNIDSIIETIKKFI